MPQFKPESYTTVSPYLIADNAAATIEFLKQAFDAIELRRFAGNDGRLMHAEVRIDDSVLMLADVKDVDSTYGKALELGAVSVQEPVKKDDEDKRGGIRDSGGTTWWIATRME